MTSTYTSEQNTKAEGLNTFVHRAINLLMQNQISETLILSSYKISTVMKNYFGMDYKTEQIGRYLARIAKEHKLKKISTKIPKYELKKSKFRQFKLPD
jgi:hypothetical protein